jgi:O-antigen ligase
MFLLAAASVWASPILYQYYVNLPLSAQQRMGGFFGNPNEAAMASLVAVALVLGVPFRNRLLQISLPLMAVGAIALTFSKTAMSCLVLILAWHVFQRAKGIMLFILPAAAVLAIVTIQDVDVPTLIAENSWIELDPSQKIRILAVGKILGGEIDENTTTGRTYLWALVVERAWDRFPLGSGIGSGHNVIGGIVENDVWQGAHNSFIMILGESGPLPAALLAASIIVLFVAVKRNPIGQAGLSCLFILVIDMMATHGALATRYHNLMLAVVMGLMAIRRGVATRQHAPFLRAAPVYRELRVQSRSAGDQCEMEARRKASL